MRRRSVWLYGATAVDACQGHVATWLVDVGTRLLTPAFLQQPHPFPDEVRGAKAVGLGDAPAQCVVLVAEDLALGLAVFARPHHRHLGQPVLVVVAVVLLRVAADAFSDQTTEAVVVVALVLQHLDAVVLYPASALAAEAAFLQRADAVARQVVVKVFVALGM